MSTSTAVSPRDLSPTLQPRISLKAPITYIVIGLLSVLWLGLGSKPGSKTTFVLSGNNDAVKFDPLIVTARPTVMVISLLIFVLAAYALYRAMNRTKAGIWVPVLVGILALVAFLVWSGSGKDTQMPVQLLLSQGLIFAVPIAFGAMAGLINERVGVINIAIEGQLLAGAFAAAVFVTIAGNPYVAFIAAPIAGALIGVLLALFAIKYRVDQIVVGVVLNVLVIGLTNYFFSTVLKDNAATLNAPKGLDPIAIPLLSKIPIIGGPLFNQNALVYLMFIFVIGLQFFLFRSRWGLRLRAVGEHPKAADTVGIKVNRTRWINVIVGGAVAGLGGIAFTVAQYLPFGRETTAGKGYIALAAMILGRWNPNGALAAALFFGFAESLRGTLSVVGSPVPNQFLQMLPYLATIFAVAGLVGKVRAPAAEGVPYVK